MIDRLFTAFLTFALLAGGSLAIGLEFVRSNRPAAQPPRIEVVRPPMVEIVGRRLQPQTDVAAAPTTEPSTPRVE